MKEIARLNVWSNGKVVRRFVGQDVNKYVRRTSPERGFRKMIAVLYEEGSGQDEVISPRPSAVRELYGETPYDAYRAGYEAGYHYGYHDGLRKADPDMRTPGERLKNEGEAIG